MNFQELLDKVVESVMNYVEEQVNEDEVREIAEEVIHQLQFKGVVYDKDLIYLATTETLGIIIRRLNLWKLEKRIED